MKKKITKDEAQKLNILKNFAQNYTATDKD